MLDHPETPLWILVQRDYRRRSAIRRGARAVGIAVVVAGATWCVVIQGALLLL